ncbi:EpsG family protein [Lactiplantibacillus plajomi]|uniref:EpsG family protein n=3 Tax=Lactiplantibacillus plajomi TaxID=1457217 RepID=A0ABV6K2S8_9LACO
MFLIASCFAFFSEYELRRTLPDLRQYTVTAKFKRSRILFWLAAIPYFIIAALRYRVGTDYLTYIQIQIPQLLQGNDARLKFEYLYQFVIKIGMSLGGTQVVFALTHLIFLFFIWKAVQFFSTDYVISLFIFMFGCYYNLSLNIMRQSIAMAIFLMATVYIVRSSPVKYVVTVIGAMLFHKTAIIYLPMYLLSKIKVRERMAICTVIVLGVLASPIRKVLVWLTDITGVYASYFNSRYDVLDRQWDLILFNLFILLMYAYLHHFFSKATPGWVYEHTLISKVNEERFNNLFFNLQVIATAFAGLSSVIPNSTRIIMMFSLGQIIYVPYLIQKIRDVALRRWFLLVFIFCYVGIFIRLIIMKNLGETLPYQFI